MHTAVLANALQQIHAIVISFVLYKIDPANETNRASNTHTKLYTQFRTERSKTIPASGTSP